MSNQHRGTVIVKPAPRKCSRLEGKRGVGGGGAGGPYLRRGQGGGVAHRLLHVRRLHVQRFKLVLKLVHETRDLKEEMSEQMPRHLGSIFDT